MTTKQQYLEKKRIELADYVEHFTSDPEIISGVTERFMTELSECWDMAGEEKKILSDFPTA